MTLPMDPAMRICQVIKTFAFTVALTLMGAVSACVFADSPAQFAPAESGLYLEINDIAQLRKEWESDPLADFIRKNIPMPTANKGWADAKAMLGMTDAQLIDTYFGQSAALVFRSPGDSEPGMVISKVAAKDAEHFRDRFKLKHVRKIGTFESYVTPDDKADVLIGGGWMIVLAQQYAVPIRDVITGNRPSLASDATFKTWIAKLPAKRTGTAFIRDRTTRDVHVAGLVKRKRNLSLHYVGKSQEYAAVFAMIKNGKTNEFGPLPASTLAAASFNLQQDPKTINNKHLEALAAPKSFGGDIMPQIGSPFVAFLGEVKGEEFDTHPGLDIPAPGFAIKLKNHEVADDITRILDSTLLFANIAMAKWEVDPILVKESTHKNIKFKTANVGIALSQRTERPELKSLVLSYGRVGDWYIICAQDHFYRKCIDAKTNPDTGLANSESFKALGLVAHDEPIASGFMRPDQLSSHVQTWLDHWRRVRPDVFKSLDEPKSAEAQFIRGIQITKGLLSQFKTISVQAHKRGDEMVARLDVIRD